MSCDAPQKTLAFIAPEKKFEKLLKNQNLPGWGLEVGHLEIVRGRLADRVDQRLKALPVHQMLLKLILKNFSSEKLFLKNNKWKK